MSTVDLSKWKAATLTAICCAGLSVPVLASVRESASFSNVNSVGELGFSGNTVTTTNLVGGYEVRMIRVTGTLRSVIAETWASDASIVATAPNGSVNFLEGLSFEEEFDGTTTVNADIYLERAVPASGTWSFQFFESYDDGPGTDAAWQALTLSFDDGISPPPPATDLGIVIPGGAVLAGVPLAADQVLWYAFTLPRAVDVGLGSYLEISTAGSVLGADIDNLELPNDTSLSVFTSRGLLVATNEDVREDDFTSLLSFGDGSGGSRSGEDGRLDPGVYYLAVSASAEAAPANFAVSPYTNQAGTIALRISTNLTACESPQIVGGPSNQVADQGGSAHFEVSATGAGTLTYQWQHNGQDLAEESGHISGSRSRTLSIANARTTDAGKYAVVVSNGCNAEASAVLDVRCLADFNRDGFVTGDDFDTFVPEFIQGNSSTDFNGDGFVTGDDFDAFVQAFTAGDCERCPEPVVVLPATDLSQATAKLHWQSNATGAMAFQVDLSTNGHDFSEHGVVPANTRSLVLNGLTGDTHYWARVQACGESCCSDQSNLVEFTTVTAPPDAPSHLSASEIWDTTIDFRWRDHSPNEGGFRVEKFESSAWQTLGIASANATTLRVGTGLLPSTTYPIRVTAFNSGGSASSSTFNVRTGPARPLNIRVSNVTPYDAIVRWDDVSSDESKFVVWLDRWSGSDWVREQTADNAANDIARHLSPPSLSQGTRYRVTVRSHRNDGTRSGISNWAEFTTTLDVPSQPTDLVATDVWDTAIDLRWNDTASNEGGFHIQRLIGPSWHTIVARPANAVTARLEAPEFTITPSTDYSFRVVAFNNNGNSTPSNEIHLRSGPACPSNVRATSIYRNYADIAWSDIAVDEDLYRVFWQTWNGSSWQTVGFRETTANDTALRIPDPAGTYRFTPNTRYRTFVRAYRNDGTRSGICEYIEFTTKP